MPQPARSTSEMPMNVTNQNSANSVARRKTALLTGGARGIGAAIKEKLEGEGINVIAPSRNELDLASKDSIRDYFKTSASLDIDILINNAGINPIWMIEEIPEADLSEVLMVNLEAPILLIKHFSRNMCRKGWGRIINISSIWASVSKPGRGAYSAAKAGLEGITRTAAIELGQYGVLVNAVSPGFVKTELTIQNNSSEDLRILALGLPLRRLADTYEIAELVSFLCSERNTFITGQAVIIDGGFACL